MVIISSADTDNSIYSYFGIYYFTSSTLTTPYETVLYAAYDPESKRPIIVKCFIFLF